MSTSAQPGRRRDDVGENHSDERDVTALASRRRQPIIDLALKYQQGETEALMALVEACKLLREGLRIESVRQTKTIASERWQEEVTAFMGRIFTDDQAREFDELDGF